MLWGECREGGKGGLQEEARVHFLALFLYNPTVSKCKNTMITYLYPFYGLSSAVPVLSKCGGSGRKTTPDKNGTELPDWASLIISDALRRFLYSEHGLTPSVYSIHIYIHWPLYYMSRLFKITFQLILHRIERICPRYTQFGSVCDPFLTALTMQYLQLNLQYSEKIGSLSSVL